MKIYNFLFSIKKVLEAIILAAGLSSRMGEKNKLLLPFRGKTILQHTVDTLLASQIDRIIVVTGYEQEKITSLLEKKSVSFIHNENYEQGQLTSIQKGLSKLSNDCTAFMICLSDMPLLRVEDYGSLIQTYEITKLSQPIVMPHNGVRAGNPKLFHINYKKEILDLDATKHQGAKAILKKHFDNIISYRTEISSFFIDIDTPAAYQSLLNR